jgi:hypothetical protein
MFPTVVFPAASSPKNRTLLGSLSGANISRRFPIKSTLQLREISRKNMTENILILNSFAEEGEIR